MSVIGLVGWVVLAAAFAQEPDLGWIVGHWQGGADGTVIEEHWEPALGGAMLGMFRMVKGDEVVFYELITIEPRDGVPTMRIKHFDADLVGGEPRKKAKDFALVEHGPNRAVFHSAAEERWIVYERDGDALEIQVRRGLAPDSPSNVFTFTLR